MLISLTIAMADRQASIEGVGTCTLARDSDHLRVIIRADPCEAMRHLAAERRGPATLVLDDAVQVTLRDAEVTLLGDAVMVAGHMRFDA